MKRWIAAPADPGAVATLEREGFSSFMARILAARNIRTGEEAKRFLNPRLEDLEDPVMMKGMAPALARIRKALENRESIAVYGDYDCDGVCATSILYLALRDLGARVQAYIPDRFQEGYGLHEEAIRELYARGVRLIITVDTGITALRQAETARSLGMDLIITDHHQPPAELPRALAVVNPKQPGCPYPDKNLCGAGIAFKMVQGLLGRVPEEFLDLAAIATVADLVPLMGENRILVHFGLKQLQNPRRPGVAALIKSAGLDGRPLSSGHLGFQLGPRLNAAGRLETANAAFRLLTTADPEEARKWAEQLETLNRARQQLCDEIAAAASEEINRHPEWQTQPSLVLAGEGWNPGVIGIVASRMVEQHYRPTLVIALDGDTAKGSARSIPGFDLYSGLKEIADLFDRFGGHTMAAGFSLPAGRVEDLRRRFAEVAASRLTPEDLRPRIVCDAEIRLDQINLRLAESMAALEPHGLGNPAPKLFVRSAPLLESRTLGASAAHLRLRIGSPEHPLTALAWRRGDDIRCLAQGVRAVHLVGRVQINEWNGAKTVQLELDDWRPAHKIPSVSQR
ncbi:single-stranded-DNA-specific exonuclease RecJ [Kyrpidia spormannii]|uniref:Single-stranded-DNA-specific exonuclease RecJ n=1 Tax=Kyrpidia spormannii TaxID=2055160 RepID=A0ACA8ZC33_9BACL|nr:single-stranded-DNA-specific exonuclease RecJ [Kyrpidia spormannii]CAB3394448.1 Single-stranded-DNA-specific exonuclease RecJ [Kyrpidia spormannii]